MSGLPRTAFARSRTQRFMPETCTVHREGASAWDGAGGWSGAYAPVAELTNVPCRLTPRPGASGTAGERAFADRIASEGDWLIAFPALTDVRSKDRVAVTIAGQPARTFEVLGSDGPRSHEAVRHVAAAEVQP